MNMLIIKIKFSSICIAWFDFSSEVVNQGFAFIFFDSINTDQIADREQSDLVHTVSWMSNINLCPAEPVFILF